MAPNCTGGTLHWCSVASNIYKGGGEVKEKTDVTFCFHFTEMINMI